MNKVEELKGEGKYREAGALAHQLGLGRFYGCHYGMKSTRDASREAFFEGYDADKADRDEHARFDPRFDSRAEMLRDHAEDLAGDFYD